MPDQSVGVYFAASELTNEGIAMRAQGINASLLGEFTIYNDANSLISAAPDYVIALGEVRASSPYAWPTVL